MKFLTTLCSLCFILAAIAQGDCKHYVPSEVGSTWEHTHYSRIDRVIGFTTYEIISKTESVDSSIFQIRASSIDEGANAIYINDFEASCIDSVFEFDMRFLLNGSLTPASNTVEYTVESNKLPIPSMDVDLGTFLDNGSLKLEAYMEESRLYQITVDITDRLILAHETVETSAGSFECLKLSQTVDTKKIFKNRETSNVWYSEGVGLVRSESFDKQGTLTGYTLLTVVDLK